VQTIRSTQTLWPASVIAGIKTEGWVSTSQKLKFQALALDLTGKPQAGVTLNVRAVARITTTSRKRMVGGFYTYDNKTETKDIGTVCSGKSDARGLLLCESELKEAGEVELIASATDSEGRDAKAVSSCLRDEAGRALVRRRRQRPHRRAAREEELPARRGRQVPGAQPFRFATALVAVEREGIIETHVVQLDGKDPTVTLQVKPAGARTSTSACSPCAAACAKCRGTASSPGASRRRASGGPPSGTKARNTSRRPRWST
jgi:hypothetical protein